MRRRFLIIHNQLAGEKDSPLVYRCADRLRAEGCVLRFETAPDIDADARLAAEAARRGGYDAVLAAGGDSTIRGVATGLMGTNTPLGIIPAGTGNVLAQEIGLRRDAQAVTDCLLHGDVRPVRMGLVNGRPFLLMAGVGFDAQAVKELKHTLKQKVRKIAYIWPVLRALRQRPPELSVSFDEDAVKGAGPRGGMSYRAGFVVVARARHYGGHFVVAPKADLASDRLHVVMFMAMSRLGLIRSLLGVALGRNRRVKTRALDEYGRDCGTITRAHGVMIRDCVQVRVDARQAEPVLVQLDGEWCGQTPLLAAVAEPQLRLIVPRKT